MAFQEINGLDADTTVALGGTNRKTGKKNPEQIEGYYLGRREIADVKRKTGKSYIYIFQTATGNVGVWGKTDIDKKMVAATPGLMTRITFTGMRSTPNGEMYTYRVEADPDNTIEVGDLLSAAWEEEEDGEEFTEVPAAVITKQTIDKSRVNALLNGKGKK
ncbi:unnamed protein product [Sphagnum balticum]